MRLELTISDQLFNDAQHAAQVVGVSVEKFMTEALEFRLQDDFEGAEKISLSIDQVALIRKSQAEIKAGNFLTSDELRAELAANRAAWRAANPIR